MTATMTAPPQDGTGYGPGAFAQITGPVIAAVAAYAAGFRGDALRTAVAVAGPESGYNPSVVNDNPATGDYSVGLWQINYYGNLRASRTAQFGPPEGLKDPFANARAAYAISNGGANWTPWGGYNSGRYRAFLTTADQAIAGSGATGTGATAVPLDNAQLASSSKATSTAPAVLKAIDGALNGFSANPLNAGKDVGIVVARAAAVGLGLVLVMGGLFLIVGSIAGIGRSAARVIPATAPAAAVADAVDDATPAPEGEAA